MSLKRRLFLFHRRVADPSEQGAALACVRAVLALPAWAYGAISRGRNALYDRGVLRAHRADAPVISVGNITAGGTGKTPLVVWLARLLAIHKMQPAVLSRGYGGDQKTGVDDENEMLRRKVPGAAVVVNPDRAKGARTAVDAGATVLVLDDGFQHRRLARDLNVVLIDATRPFGGEWMLPRGMLREPLSGLSRADCVVISRSNLVPKARVKAIRKRLEDLAPGAVAVTCGLAVSALRPLAGAPPLEPAALTQDAWHAFCGIGNPEGFRRTLEEAGCRLGNFSAFADHEPYTPEQVQALLADAREADCRGLVCTEKDAVKVERLLRDDDAPPVYALSTDLEFGDGRAEFVAAILRAIGRTSQCVPA